MTEKVEKSVDDEGMVDVLTAGNHPPDTQRGMDDGAEWRYKDCQVARADSVEIKQPT